MGRAIDGVKGREWDEWLRRYAISQLTVGEFCVWEGVSVAAIYVWRKSNRTPMRPYAAPKMLLLPEEFCRIDQPGAACFGS